jgi:hypothetical protein
MVGTVCIGPTYLQTFGNGSQFGLQFEALGLVNVKQEDDRLFVVDCFHYLFVLLLLKQVREQ